jgi:hypothetical protein
MKKRCYFLKLKLGYGQGYWFTAEYFENEVLKLGEGCHFSDKKLTEVIELITIP